MRRIILIGGCFIVGVFILLGFHRRAEAPSPPPSGETVVSTHLDDDFNELSFPNDNNDNKSKGPTVSIGKTVISIEIAKTEASRILGLGGRDAIASNAGMLFVFSTSDFQGIWMKGMRFPLDILWLQDAIPHNTFLEDGIGERTLLVVDLKEQVAPETYPEVFFPPKKASYVLEMKGGEARRRGIEVGSILTLKP